MPASDATFRTYEYVTFETPSQITAGTTSFRLYENVGFAAADPTLATPGTFRVYENVGYYLASPLARDTAYTSYMSIGIEPMTPIQYPSAIAYNNVGVIPGTRKTISIYPRGWGVIPTNVKTTIVLDEASAATATAYENIV